MSITPVALKSMRAANGWSGAIDADDGSLAMVLEPAGRLLPAALKAARDGSNKRPTLQGAVIPGGKNAFKITSSHSA
jgi:hypothetical protein